MGKHTPGPWEYDGYGDHVSFSCATGRKDYDFRLEPGAGGMTAEELDHTAALIAAAPDLLAALEDAADWINENRDHPDTGEGQQASFLLDCIGAAIAKATNQEGTE